MWINCIGKKVRAGTQGKPQEHIQRRYEEDSTKQNKASFQQQKIKKKMF